MDDSQAAAYTYKVIRRKAKKNPCYLCEQTDCEGCEHFVNRPVLLTTEDSR